MHTNPRTMPKVAPEPTALHSGTARTTRARLAPLILALSALLGLIASVMVSLPSDAQETTDEEEAAAQALLDDLTALDGTGNNLDNPQLGTAGLIYPRLAEANYADGIGELADRPAERYLSNRIFNGSNQNVFSENGVTHWGFVWGQFIDHTIGLRAGGDEDLLIGFDPSDPLESFVNDLGGIATTRSATADGSGVDTPRDQINTVSSYIDGWAVYGGTDARLDWMREGPLDGDPTNNDATLLTDDGYLPNMLARTDGQAPDMELMGRLFANPTAAVVAGDVRANENLGLLAVQTLFVREHNRIVDELPDDLDEETKFQIARRLVTALQQYITYNEFLAAMGVDLDIYQGYDPSVDPSITNEFATVGYRAHSQIHGEFEAEIPLSELTDSEIEGLEAAGVSVELTDEFAEVAIPLSVAFGNPALLPEIGLGNLLAGLASEAAYANDEQIDNQLRSVLFQIPGPNTENPLDCLDGAAIAECYSGVNDLGALDVIRAYDHGMPTYNDLRVAFGLDPVSSFAELTGEDTQDFPTDTEIDADNAIDDPNIMDFVFLADGNGNELELGSDAADGDTVVAVRRTTIAARLNAIFGDVDTVDAFTGMVSEPHIAGTEFGELQLAMWTSQFAALRDGDRYFYENDAVLDQLVEAYGVTFDRSLADVIAANSSIDSTGLSANVFLVADQQSAPDQAEASTTTQSDADPADTSTVGGTGGGSIDGEPDESSVEVEADGNAEAGEDDETDRGDGDRRRRTRDGDRGNGRGQRNNTNVLDASPLGSGNDGRQRSNGGRDA